MNRKYRSSLPVAIGVSCATLALLVGIAMAVPASTSDVAQNVIGGFAIAVACWVGGVTLTNGVWLTPEGIVKRQTFRRTTIQWDAVESLTVAPVPRNQAWRTIRVEMQPPGHVYLIPVAGRERHVQEIIAEFEAYRAQHSNVARTD